MPTTDTQSKPREQRSTKRDKSGKADVSILGMDASAARPQEPDLLVRPELPSMPAAPPDGAESASWRADLREFHVAGGSDEATDEAPLFPAAVHPLEDRIRCRRVYPFYLPQSSSQEGRPFSQVLERALESAAEEGGDCPLLKGRLDRLLREVAAVGLEAAGTVDIQEGFAEGRGRFLSAFVDLSPQAESQLREELSRLQAHLPKQGVLVPFAREALAPFLAWVWTRHRAPGAEQLRKDVRHLTRALRNLLEADRSLRDQARTPEVLQRTLGQAGQGLDPQALSKLRPAVRGPLPMTAQRQERIEEALEILDPFDSAPDQQLSGALFHSGEVPAGLAEAIGKDSRHKDPFAAALGFFDEMVARRCRLYRAMRLARLEVEDAYDPGLHDRPLARLSWESFSQEELRALPPVLVFESAQGLRGDALASFSRVLRGRRPIQILLSNDDPLLRFDGAAGLSWDAPLDLGYLAVAHREALVVQSSLVEPAHLLAGLTDLAEALDPSLAIVAVPETERRDEWSWLLTWTAHAGRATPCFRYSPAKGETWAERFDVQANSSIESPFPSQELAFQSLDDGSPGSLELPLTFAHAATLNPKYRSHFKVIPPEAWNEEQVPLAEYLSAFAETPPLAIPYLWIIDERGGLARAALSREMAAACRERKRSWRVLQELAGVGNEYVRRAEEELKRRLEEKAAAEREAILEQARQEGAAAAVERIVALLLSSSDGEVSYSPPHEAAAPAPRPSEARPTASPQTAGQEPSAAAEAPTEQAPAQPEPISEEAYIDTILCTSCNDCIKVNALLFRYNADNQAEIADLEAGTFAQLVQAAEACPAHCIHPGSPRPQDASATPEVLARAAKLEGG